MYKTRTLIVVETLVTQGDICYLVYDEQININIQNNCLNNFFIFFRQIIIMAERHAEPMEFEEEMTPPSFREMKRYEGNDSQVSDVVLENPCFDTENEGRIVSHDSFVSTREGGEICPRNESTPPISSLIKETGISYAPSIARKDDHNEVSATDLVTSNERVGNSEIPKNVLPLGERVQMNYTSPYLSIRDALMKVPYIRKTIIHNIPKTCLPLYPAEYPMSSIVTCNDGKRAIINRIPARNTKEPPFFSPSVKDLGAAVNLEHFICKSGYTVTFDTLRKCRTCTTEHDIFPKNNVGTLILGDAYTPPMVGNQGRCIPVFRMEHPSFTDIGEMLKYLLRPRVDQNGHELARPNLIIISLPSYLGVVGPERYMKEFSSFKKWIQEFITSGRDFDTRNSKVFRSYIGPVEVYEGFSLFVEGDFGLAESYAVLNRSMNINNALEPAQTPGFLFDAYSRFISKLNTTPPRIGMVAYVSVPPTRPDFPVYEEDLIYPGVPAGLQDNDGTVSESVYSGFYCEITEKLQEKYIQLGNETELYTLPQPLDFVIKTPNQIAEARFLFDQILPFPVDLRPRVFVIGHSNMRFLTEELRVVLDGDLKFIEYTPKLNSSKNEIDSFFSSLNLQFSDTIVFSGLSNMVIQGSEYVRFQGVKPTGSPANHEKEKLPRVSVHHLLAVSPYDATYFNRFATHTEHIMEERFNHSGARFINILPLPRYQEKCCDKAGHFDAHYDGGDLCAELLRLGVYLSRLPCNKFALCITPEDICPRNNWGIRGEMIGRDQVHLTDTGVKLLTAITHRAILSVNNPPPTPKPRLDTNCLIPAGLSFSEWVSNFREVCGYDSIIPTSAAKRAHPFNGVKSVAKKR